MGHGPAERSGKVPNGHIDISDSQVLNGAVAATVGIDTDGDVLIGEAVAVGGVLNRSRRIAVYSDPASPMEVDCAIICRPVGCGQCGSGVEFDGNRASIGSILPNGERCSSCGPGDGATYPCQIARAKGDAIEGCRGDGGLSIAGSATAKGSCGLCDIASGGMGRDWQAEQEEKQSSH